ncbi:hypothetical protein ACUN0G_13185 [Pseudomonas sp. 32A]|uniref:hypothetical protein n=1 Tax=Pseudomonas sp. 32A TaxID=651185 RepID=UPI004045C066
MTAPSAIDTTNLLTILGVVAAVWALISPTSKLQLRFCLTWLDWTIGFSILFLAHYLVFAPALMELGLYYSLGPWRWGLNSSSAVYLLLLTGALYFFWRTRTPSLVRGKIPVFRELIENFLFTKRYGELVLHVEPQLPKLIRMSKGEHWLVRWIDCVAYSRLDFVVLLHGRTPPSPSMWRQGMSKVLRKVKVWFLKMDHSRVQARETLLILVTSPELVHYLAVTHPYFCLKLTESDEATRSDFIEECLDAMLAAPGSRLYVELKNNQNLNSGNRLALPESNRLLRFFFADASKAADSGVSQAIGNAVLRRLSEDRKLVTKLNEPLMSYFEQGRFRCPINSGITMFEIMVHEGIHQGLTDHMWLHYFQYFAKEIIKQMLPLTARIDHLEWPTPFHYLLYRLISVATDWAEQCARIKDSEIPEEIRNVEGFDRYYISKQATKSMGEMLQIIIPSEKISDSFKRYLLGVVIRGHNKLQANADLVEVANTLRTEVIQGIDMQTTCDYRRDLQNQFKQLDHRLRMDAEPFEKALQLAITECEGT